MRKANSCEDVGGSYAKGDVCLHEGATAPRRGEGEEPPRLRPRQRKGGCEGGPRPAQATRRSGGGQVGPPEAKALPLSAACARGMMAARTFLAEYTPC